MGKKHEEIAHPRMFYTFVDLGSPLDHTTKVFVVPSRSVARAVKESHSAWLCQPGRNGHVRNDSNMRRFLPDYSHIFGAISDFGQGWLDQYEEAWEQLKEEKLQ